MMRMFEDLLFSLQMLLLGVAIFVGLVAPIIWLALWYEERQCNTYQEVTGRDTKYLNGTCYVKDNGEWFSWPEYKLRNATTGVKQ